MSPRSPLRFPAAPRQVLAFLPLALALAAGCGGDDASGSPDAALPPPDAGPDAAVAPAFRNPVDLPDGELAAQVLAFLGAPVDGQADRCNDCHGITRQNLRHWRALGDASLTSCLTDLEVASPAAANQMIDCLRSDPAMPDSQFDVDKLGIYSTAANLDWFAYLFRLAHGDAAAGAAAHAEFVARVTMPRGDHPPLSQPEFDLVAEYFARGLPMLDAVMPDDPPPQDCTPGVSADVTAHVAEMASAGWAALNHDASLLMYGCGLSPDPRDCLIDEPREAGWEVPGGAVIRTLVELPYKTAFWTRSSADGRFVGHGVAGQGFDAAFVDLIDDDVVPAAAFYDPGFFPDNSGFALQENRARFCPQSVLTADPDQVTFDEPGCSSTNQVGLYQHLGAALGGGDYWTVDSQFVSDNGGHQGPRGDPAASFSIDGFLRLTPMIHDGSGYAAGTTVAKSAPFEGDVVISPSARLTISRLAGPGEQQLGFVVRQIVATPSADGYAIETPEVARYCINGGKPAFSFDERWLVLHHYVGGADAIELGFTGPDDPAFAPYLAQGSANLYLLDVLDGSVRRITTMGPGEFALFPHFRSDGWIYFNVRRNAGVESIAATDAALIPAP